MHKIGIKMVKQSVSDLITAKLKNAFAPDYFKIIDVSNHHRGHAGWREGGETHFQVILVCKMFSGKSLIDRHRAVNKILASELADSIHALTLTTLTGDEASQRGIDITPAP